MHCQLLQRQVPNHGLHGYHSDRYSVRLGRVRRLAFNRVAGEEVQFHVSHRLGQNLMVFISSPWISIIDNQSTTAQVTLPNLCCKSEEGEVGALNLVECLTLDSSK